MIENWILNNIVILNQTGAVVVFILLSSFVFSVRKIILALGDNEMFAYVYTDDSSFSIEIDNDDIKFLKSVSGNLDEIYKWILKNKDKFDYAEKNSIRYIEIETDYDPDLEDQETVEIWSRP